MSEPATVPRQVPLSRRERRELAFSPDAIGIALHSRRVADGLSQSALADRLRVTQGTIRNWELGGMPAVAARLLSYTYEQPDAEELWRFRALAAEVALREVAGAIVGYRGEVHREREAQWYSQRP